MHKPPEIGYRLRNRQGGPSFNLTDEFIVKLRIFYDEDFNQQFGSDSEDR